MFITKKHISRRTVLRGLGTMVSLPFLEAMVPAQTRLSQTAASPRSRLACIEVVHGDAGSTAYGTEENLHMPAKEGANFEFTKILKPLEPFRDYLTVVSMMDCHPAEPYTPEEVGADHFRSSAVYLTGSHPKQTEGSDVLCGPSIDQIYAQKFGQDTPLPSIQLHTENEDAGAGTSAFHYSSVYMNTISWATPTQPLPMTYNPRMAFEELFGSGGSEADRAERRRINRSIVDIVIHNAAALKKGLGASDRTRVDSYLENVREIERRIQAIEAYNAGAKRELPDAPTGVPESWDEFVKLMLDLQVLAFSAETTRVSAMKLGFDASNRVFPESGVRLAFHMASHHAEAPRAIEEFAKINAYHHSLVAYFADKLKNTPDGDGNLLDHSLVLYGSPMGDSNVHTHRRVPFVLLGHASGTVKGNFHLKTAAGTPQANGLLTILHKLGVDDIDTVGDSTGTIAV